MTVKVAIIDYRSGNIFSMRNALETVGVEHVIVNQPEELTNFDALVLPGVGAFGNAVHNLTDLGLFEAIQAFKKTGRPVVGVCLGMQLFFEGSSESLGTPGLGFFPGHAEPFTLNSLETRMNVGWRECHSASTDMTDLAITPGKFYFIHAFRVPWTLDFEVSTWSARSDGRFVAAIRSENVIGFQYHPEKSGPHGLEQLKHAVM